MDALADDLLGREALSMSPVFLRLVMGVVYWGVCKKERVVCSFCGNKYQPLTRVYSSALSLCPCLKSVRSPIRTRTVHRQVMKAVEDRRICPAGEFGVLHRFNCPAYR
jgi:hypothetical protein